VYLSLSTRLLYGDGVLIIRLRRYGNWRSAVRTPLKVNLILLMVAAIVIEVFALVSTPFLENMARAEVLQKARIMMEAAAGIRPTPPMKSRRC
jgi:hypothetical protein